MPTSTPTVVARLVRPLSRAAVFSVAWLAVSQADPAGFGFGAAFVALATAASLLLTPSHDWRVRPSGLLRYLAFFLHRSLVSGIDVGLRALRPSMPLDPEFVRYRTRLGPEYARVLFANTVSMLPGTLSAGFEGDWFVSHVLDCHPSVDRDLREVEERIAHLFGLTLEPWSAERCVCADRVRDGEPR
ncbi:MAG TPA: Na+/H+ antiporter subunit E [Coriobacteriia bacterium]|nr:Na+/H+ antiporter subunit E [Coriobacteriia bacterium]